MEKTQLMNGKEKEVIKMPQYIVTVNYKIAVNAENEEDAELRAWEAISDYPDGFTIKVEEGE